MPDPMKNRRGAHPENTRGSISNFAFGALLLVVGMGVSLIALLPLVSNLALSPAWWWAALTLVGVGMGLLLMGLARNGGARARQQRAARTVLNA